MTLDALKALIVRQHERLLTREREVEHLKLLIARLQRMQFGPKSEKLAQQIEQLELRLEELQSEPSEDSSPIAPANNGGCRVQCRFARRSHMKRIVGSVAICVWLLGVSIQAQAPQGPPKPGPEVKRLAYFVGNWKEEGKSTAHGMTGPVSSTQKWEWVSGGFFIVGHSDNKSPAGDFKIMAVLGYDPETKMYTYNAFDSWGELITAKGNVSGNTWTWITETMMQGKPMKTRLTEKEVSKTQYTLKYESSTDGGDTWTSDLESTFTKVAPIP